MSDTDVYPVDFDTVNTLLTLKKIIAYPSLALVVFIFILFLSAKNITHKISQQCILFQIIIEILYLIFLLLPYDTDSPDGTLCFVESLLINLFSQLKLVTALVMSYICVLDTTNKLLLETHHKLFAFILFIFTIIISSISPIYLCLYEISGNFGSYCFLALNDQESRIYIVKTHLYFLIFKSGIVFTTFYLLFKNYQFKKSIQKIKGVKIVINSKQNLVYFPLGTAIFSLIDLITNIYKIYNINESTFWIEFLHILLNCSGGIYIFTLFVKMSLFQTLFSRIYKKLKNKRKKKNKRFTARSIKSFSSDASPIIPMSMTDNLSNI